MNKSKIIGSLAIILAATLWAVEGIVFLPSLFHLDVALVVFLLHAFGFSYMFFILIWERKELSKMAKSDWGAFVLVALFGGSLGTLAIVKALFFVNFVPLTIVVLIQKLQPVFAVALAFLILKERPPRTYYFYALLALLSAYLITFGWSLPVLNVGDKLTQASLLAFLAAFCFGAGTVFGKQALQKVNFRVATALRFGLTMLIMALIVTLFGTWGDLANVTSNNNWLPALMDYANPGPMMGDIQTFIWIAVTTSGFGIFFYYFGLKRVLASESTLLELAYPAAAILLDFLWRGTVLGWVQWIGVLLLIFVSVRISLLKTEPVGMNGTPQKNSTKA